MNKIYKTKYNATTGTVVVVSELASNKGKTSSKSEGGVRRSRALRNAVLAALGSFALAQPVLAAGLSLVPDQNGVALAYDDPDSIANAKATERYSIAVGRANAEGMFSYALGSDAIARSGTTQADVESAVGGAATAIGKQAHALGKNTTAIGVNAKVYAGSTATAEQGANNATAIGTQVSAQNFGATAIGYITTATGYRSVAVGSDGTTASGAESTALGYQARSAGAGSAAIADRAAANGSAAVAIGQQSNANGTQATAVGAGAVATNDQATALGVQAEARGVQSIAIGRQANASADNAIAIGFTSSASGAGAIATGPAANASGGYAIAIGRRAVASQDNAVALGSESVTRGASNATTAYLPDSNGDTITYLGFAGVVTANSGRVVSVGTVGGERQIQNVAAGEISATSTDAINGSQLYVVASALQPRPNYLHVNDGNNDGGDADANLALPHEAGGARNNGAIAVGVNAQAQGGDRSIAIGSGDSDNDIAAARANGQEAVAIGGRANANGQAAIAMGSNATASNANAIAIGTNAFTQQTQNIAIGLNTQAIGNNSMAIGPNAQANTDAEAALSIGPNALATNEVAIAIGKNTVASGTRAVAMAQNAQATGSYAIAIGNKTEATHGNAIAMGSYADAMGDYAVAIAYNSKATAQAAIAVGRTANASGVDAVAVGREANATAEDATALGRGANANSKNSVALGVTSLAREADTIAVGNGAQATAANAIAFGRSAIASQARSVALGDNATTVAPVAPNTVTVNGVTYSGFAGNSPIGTVSVGRAGEERQIHNVAAGRISGTSTDAINGSQLYMVANEVGNRMASFTTSVNGTKAETINNKNNDVNFVNGNATTARNVNNQGDITFDVKVDGKTMNVVNGQLVASNTQVVAGTNTTVTNTAANGNPPIYKVDSRDTVLTGSQGVEVTGGTLDDSKIRTYNVAAKVDGTTITINNNGELTAASSTPETTDLTVSDGKVNAPADNTKLITAAEVAETINQSGFNLTTSKTGTGTVTGTSNELVNPGETVTVEAGNNIAITQAAGKVTVATSMTPTFDKVTINNPTITRPTAEAPAVQRPNVNINNAATIGDLLNTGWNLQGNGEAKDFVQPYETVNFKDGNATTAVVTTDGTTSNVSYNVKVDSSTITIDDNGQLTAVIPEIPYGGVVAAEEVGTIADVGDTPGFVTSDNLVDTINASGWNVTAAGANATGSKNELINPGETVTFQAGKNMTVVQSGNTFTYATQDDVNFNSVQFGNNGPKITNNGGNINIAAPDGSPVRITNVAPGKDGTDAVNVDQLKAHRTEVKGGTNIASVTSSEDADGKITYTVNADGASVSAGSDRVTATAGPKAAGTNITDYAVDLSQATKDKIDSAMQSFTTSVNGNVAETIDKNNKDVNFINGTATTARDSGGNITFDVNVDGTTISVKDNKVSANTTDLTVNNGKVNTPTNTDALITANEVAETINNSGFTLTTSKTGTGTVTGTSNELVNPGETVTIEAGNNIEVTQAAGKVTVATSMAPTFNTVTINNPNITTPTPNAPAVPAPNVNINNAATIGDVLNTGWNLQGNGKAVDFVQPYETVNFKDGNATTATVTSDGKTSTVKYDVNVDNSTITINGDGQLVANIPELPPIGEVDANSDGSIADAGSTPGVVYSDNLVDAINNSGWNVTAAGANATGASNQLINPGETVTFQAGKNMTLVQDGNTFTYATADAVDFTSITVSDGDTSTAPITINNNGIDLGDRPITNLKSNLPDTYNQNVYNTTKQATTASQPLPTNLTLTNAATVGDVLNAGWNLQEDGAAKDFVKPYDTVNFAHGTGTTVNVDVDANGEVSTVKYSVNVDNKTITTRPQTDDNGDVITDNEGNPLTELTVNTTKISANPIGTVSVTGDTTSLATAGDIANAINESGWNVTAAAGNDGAGNELVKPGETVTFDAGKNMKLTQAGQSFTYATADDVNFNSVQFGDNGPKITNNGGNINVAGPNGEPVKITNVKAGEDDNDAVNVSQLNNTVATSKETVVSTDKSVAVTTGKNADGAAEFDLSVNVDGTTITNGSNGLQVVTTDLTVTGGKVNNAGNTTSLITADEVAKTINESGWNAQSAGNLATGNQTGTTLVSPGDTVTFAAGKNLTVQRVGNTFTYATKDDVEFNKVTANQVNVGPVTISNTGIDMGNTRITNLAPGVLDDDAVNLSQLKAARTVVQVGTNIASVTHDIDEKTGRYTYTVNADGASVSAGSTRVTVTPGKKGADNVTDYAVDLSQDTKDKIDNAMSSFTTSVNGNRVETITNTNNDVGFVDGNATKAKDDGGNITFDVVVDEKTINVVNGKLTAVIPDVKIDTTDLTVTDGKVNAPANTTALITAAEVASTINESGWNVTSAKTADGELGATATVELVQPGETVTFLAGKNMKLTQDGQSFTYETKDEVEFTTITVDGGDTTTGPVIITGDGINMGGNPITDLKSNLPDTYNTNIYNIGGQPVTKSQELPLTLNVNNAATVGDILNSGWNLQGNGKAVDFVKPYDTVNFANGRGTTATVTTDANGEVSTVKYDVNVDGTTITVNNNGQLTAVPQADTTVVLPGSNVVDVTKDAAGRWTINAEGTNVRAGASGNVVVTSNGRDSQNDVNYVVDIARDLNVDSVTTGNTKIDNNGLTINGGPSVTINGIDAGGMKITNVAPGTDPTDAVNVSQLNQTVAGAKTEVEAGKNVTVTTKTGANGQTIYTVATENDVHFNSVQFGDISPTGERTGPSIQANNNGDIQVGNPQGEPVKITNVKAADLSPTSTDAVNGSQLYDTNTRISGGLNFAADYSTRFNRQLGDTVTFRGGADQNALTDNNIGIIANNGTIDVKLAKDLKGLSTAEFIDPNGNVTNVGGNGVTITPAGNTEPSRVVSLTSGGLNNGGNRITNVAPGEDGTDAVNVDQLKGAVNNIAGNINKVDRNARAGIAGALATAGLPQAYLPGKSLFAVGAGTYRGESGLAIGLSSISDGGNWIIKGTANADSRGHFGASAAIGYQW
ncbi:YadA-like family protein [Conservatibacter flavescens]|uniref:Adhesin n=1 Tax=Conservatibacter flavescens TaxID=28161 RepID=A0A2M8S3J1_9PAST|nr:YadA-like family protein [Conservatibacter flavescens]PJG85722.1 hypothetical protein CVP05_04605 [Conservatibacter flavescens]